MFFRRYIRTGFYTITIANVDVATTGTTTTGENWYNGNDSFETFPIRVSERSADLCLPRGKARTARMHARGATNAIPNTNQLIGHRARRVRVSARRRLYKYLSEVAAGFGER